MTEQTAMTDQAQGELAEALDRAAVSDVLLVALDFDGTLSLHQDDPMAARALPEAVRAIAELVRLPRTTVAFISGRSLADLRIIAEHDDASQVLLAGSHGAEFWFPGVGAVEPAEADADVALRDRLRAEAEAIVADIPGTFIEPKTFGFGVHTRLASPDDARRADAGVDALVAEKAPAWRRRTGKNIVEYAFRHEGKDSAVAALRERVHATCVVYAGDDTTDEDALASLGAGDLGIHVGAGPTAATVSVPSPPAMAEALLALATARAARE
ncbi:trehalose-phosphatase [Microbacterium sp. X-17]|uniref:trehalose-phosphatase n=1 Tax=Microbacterium sp. X-17 TaxID=3144404 RepID=UPI0031F54C1D